MTNVPLPSFTDVGFTSPPELAILQGVLADLNDAFGGNLDTNLSTPQGQLAMSLAAVIGSFNDLFVDYTNQVDPAFATGRMQDAIARIYYLTRRGATPTVVVAQLTGATGTIIPVGALAKSVDGTIYTSLSGGQIPFGGMIELQFAALENGPISCPPGALDTIYRTVPGWDSITNAAAGTPGRDEETSADLERRRALSVAANASGILPAVRGAVLGVSGVVDAYVTENVTGSTITIGSQSIVAHSLFVCVEGGSDPDVAMAIWTKKNPGCNYTGSTSVIISDTNSGYVVPPTYTVKFQRATALPIDFVVDLVIGSDVPSDAAAQVQAVVTEQFHAAARIGMPVFASAFVCAIAALGPWVRILGITVNANPSQIVNINEFPTLGTITVNIS